MKKEEKKSKTFQYFLGSTFCFGVLFWLLWIVTTSKFLWTVTIETVFVSLLISIVCVFLLPSGIYLIIKGIDEAFEGDC